jgi:glutamine synthetase
VAQVSSDDIKRMVAEHDLRSVIVGGPDINGVFRGKRVDAARFAEDPARGMHIAKVIYVMDIAQNLIPAEPGSEGWWPDWSDGFGSYHATADLDTFRVAGWLDRTALVLWDETLEDGQPLEVYPRRVLLRNVERLAEMGFTARFAAELEFFLMRETAESLGGKGNVNPTPLWTKPGVFSVYRMTLDEEVITPIIDAIKASGIDIEVWTPEGGVAQYEFNLAPKPLPQAADESFLFKHAVKEAAGKHGIMATFMPKIAPGFGSSNHLNQSLVDSQGNYALWDDTEPGNLSKVARHYIAGMLATLRDFTVVFAPTVNAYKRLLPFSAAGITANWGIDNRTTGLRAVTHAPEVTRIEHRTPGGDTNPYLAMAACIAGGMHGIENELEPPKPFEGNGYLATDVDRVPSSLAEAIGVFEQSDVANRYLGEEFVRFFAKTRRHEVGQSVQQATDWEIGRYMEYL